MHIAQRVLLVVLLLKAIPLFSQQPEIYNQFFMNPYLYNPAYAGVEGHTVVFLLYHQQWSGLPQSPTLSNVSFHTPLKGGIGIGATGFNLSEGLLMRSSGKVSASYLVTMDRKHHLRFGMSVGGGTQSVNFGELDDPTDPAFGRIAGQNSYVIADFGATYHFGHFNVGFSIPNLVGYDVFQENEFAPVKINPLDNLMLKMNYRGHLSDDIAIEPHLIYRYSNLVPDQYEATVIFHVYHIVWLGATYRQDNSVAATIGTKLLEKIGIGYSYELGNSSVFNLLGPTHEVHIGFHLGTRKAHAAHVSSFIKSHRLTAEERAEKAALEREEELLRLQASREDETDDPDELSIVGTPATQQEPTTEDEAGQPGWEVDDEAEPSTRINEFGEEEKALVITRINANGETEKAVAWVPANENWDLADPSEPPLERTASDGTREIGVKYYRTNENGEKELIVKWEPVVSPEQAEEILTTASTVEALAETPEDTPINNVQQPENQADDPADLEPDPVEPEVDPTPVEEVQEPEQAAVTETPVAEEPEVAPEEVAKGDTTLTEDFRSHDEIADSGEPLEVKRGNNLLELPVGNYVIAGAFESFQHAEDYSDELFNKGYHDTIVGYVSARGYYYTVIFRSDDVRAANAERRRVRSRPGMEKVWVLKVSE